MRKKIFSLSFTGAMMMALSAHASDFSVTSTDVTDSLTHEQFANGFGCDGGNVSPQLSWANAPKATKSFAISMYDPDAPTGSGWWHWVAINIPATVSELAAGAGSAPEKMPSGSLITANDAGFSGYLGACPPEGQSHRYVITVKALGVEKLDLPENASGALVGFMTNMNKIGEATLTLTAGR